MNGNLLNLIFIAVFLLLCFKNAKLGILVVFAIVLGLPLSFLYFGFAFGEGERYLPNIFVVALCFTGFYFIQAARARSIEGFDIAIILFIITGITATLLIEGASFNPGPLIKQFATYPLFYFMGKVFLSESGRTRETYLAFRNLLLAIGPYMLLSMLIEFIAKINFQAVLLSSFSNLVGSQVIADPIQQLDFHLLASFYRILGPQVEPTETALVCMIAIVAYLCWRGTSSNLVKVTRNVMLVLLSIAVVFSASRTALLMIVPVFAAKQILDGALKRWQVALYLIASTLVFLYAVTDPGGFVEAGLRTFYESPFYSSRLMDESSIWGRLEAWEQALRLIKDNFLFGVGEGTPLYLVGSSRSDASTAHNSFLDLLLFHGVLVTGFLVILWGMLLRRSLNALRTFRKELPGQLGLTVLLIMLVYLMLGLFTPDKPQIIYLFWFYGGLLAAATNSYSSAESVRQMWPPVAAAGANWRRKSPPHIWNPE